MGILSKIFRRGNPSTQQLNDQIVYTTVQGESLQRDTDIDNARQRDLGQFYESIHDEDREDLFAQKCMVEKLVPQVDAKGNFVYAKNDKGEVLTDVMGNPMVAMQKGFAVDTRYASIRHNASHLTDLTVLQPKDEYLVKLLLWDNIADAKMSLTPEEISGGELTYIDSIFTDMLLRLNNAVNGNKLKILTETRVRKDLEVSFGQKQKKGVI